MNIIFILIDIIWSLAMYLLGVGALMLISGAVAYFLWWAYFLSAAGPVLIIVTILIVVLSIIAAIIPNPNPKE